MIVFAFLPFFVIHALAAQMYLSPPNKPNKMPQLLQQKAKIKRVDTKSATRFVLPKDEIIVQFKKEKIDVTKAKGVAKARAFARKNNMVVKSLLQSMNAIVVQSTKREATVTAIKRLRRNSTVKLVQKNFQAALKRKAIRK